MAEEVRRVGQHYFLQTPNRYFPIEPHFVFLFFQFLLRVLQTALVRHLSLGWIKGEMGSGSSGSRRYLR
jgi:hypothetical protein